MRPQFALIPVLLLSACATPRMVRYDEPVPTLPSNWSEPLPAAAGVADVTDLKTWWRGFKDPLLDRLVDQALVNNLDLKVAAQRLIVARAERDALSGTLKPRIGISANSLQQQTSRRVEWPRGIGFTDTQSVQLEASWEIDLFGRLRQSVEAADAELGVAEEDRRSVLLSLLAEIATNYVELRSAQERLDIAERNVDRLKATFDTLTRLQRAGLASGSSVAQARAEWQSALAQLPLWRGRIARHSHAIGVLTGGFPGDLGQEFERTPHILPSAPALPVSVPSQVLRDRPDVRGAERRIAAATARQNVAVADLFPRFRIPLTLGTAASGFGSLFSAASTIWSVAATGSQTLFDDGQRKARIRAAEAITATQRLQYEQPVRVAFRDVEDALTGIETEATRREALGAATADSQTALDRALRERRAGTLDYLDLLIAQRALFAAQDSLAQSKAAQAVNLIALAKALGGGWQTVFEQERSDTVPEAQLPIASPSQRSPPVR